MTLRLLPASLLCFLVGAALSPARADNACIDRCYNTFSPLQNGGSEELRRECLEQCSSSNTRRSISYGAIAYGADSTANGYAFDKASAGEAERVALGNCRPHGKDCKIVASFFNSCVAVAAVESKDRFVTAKSGNGRQAQAIAMNTCQSEIGGKCEIEAWTCALP